MEGKIIRLTRGGLIFHVYLEVNMEYKNSAEVVVVKRVSEN